MLGPLICLLKIRTSVLVLSRLAKWTDMGKSLGSQPCVLGGAGKENSFFICFLMNETFMCGVKVQEDPPGCGLFSIRSLKWTPPWLNGADVSVHGCRRRTHTPTHTHTWLQSWGFLTPINVEKCWLFMKDWKYEWHQFWCLGSRAGTVAFWKINPKLV